MKRRGRGKATEFLPPDPVPEGHPSDQELFDLECLESDEPAHPPVSPVYIRARRRIYNLGREHGRIDAERIAAGFIEPKGEP